MDTWVHQRIRTICGRRVVAWCLVAGGALLFALGQHRYISNFIRGPFDFGQAELDTIEDVSAAPRYFVRVTGSRLIDTGIQRITTKKRAGVESRSVSATYYALVVGDRLFIVKRSEGAATMAQGDLIGTAVEARREADSPRYRGGGWRVTDKYLIQSAPFAFDLLRLSDLLWAYKKVTKHSVNFIPTGKTYACVLACYGGTAEVTGREKDVDSLLSFAAERAPWAVFGFTDELSRVFRQKTADFCAAVEQRKHELARQAST